MRRARAGRSAHRRARVPREIRLTDETDEIAERRLQDVARSAARCEDGYADEPHEHISADCHGSESCAEQQPRQKREEELQGVDVRADRDADEGADRDECDEERTQDYFPHFHKL